MAAYLLCNGKPIQRGIWVQPVLTCLCAKQTSCCELLRLRGVCVNYSLQQGGTGPTS